MNNSVLSVSRSQLVGNKALGEALVPELGGSAVRSGLLGGLLLRAGARLGALFVSCRRTSVSCYYEI